MRRVGVPHECFVVDEEHARLVPTERLAEAAHDREPVAIFTGEVLPHYVADIDDDAVRILLNDLASEIGGILEQEEVHVAYRDRTWALKADSEVTGTLSL